MSEETPRESPFANLTQSVLGLDPFDSSDASGDLDADGYSNLSEYLNGTSMTDDSSYPESSPYQEGFELVEEFTTNLAGNARQILVTLRQTRITMDGQEIESDAEIEAFAEGVGRIHSSLEPDTELTNYTIERLDTSVASNSVSAGDSSGGGGGGSMSWPFLALLLVTGWALNPRVCRRHAKCSRSSH